jgi:hypothetical protein
VKNRLSKVLYLFLSLFLIGAVLAGVTGCSSGTANTSTTPVDTTVLLTVTKGTQTKTFTMTALKALTPVSGYAGTKNKKGEINGPNPYKGVSLTSILNSVGGLSAGDSVKFTAKDDYSKTLTYDQISSATFTTYDTTGTAASPEKTPVVFVAYELNGQTLDDANGPVQLAIMTCEQQVTDGSNFVKQLVKIDVVTQ